MYIYVYIYYKLLKYICYVMLCHVMLCYVLLRYDMFCSVMLCYVCYVCMYVCMYVYIYIYIYPSSLDKAISPQHRCPFSLHPHATGNLSPRLSSHCLECLRCQDGTTFEEWPGPSVEKTMVIDTMVINYGYN